MAVNFSFTRRLYRNFQPIAIALCGVLVASLVGTDGIYAQAFHDSKGTEFWATFMESSGGAGFNEVSDMRIYLSASVPTTVTITYNGDGRSTEVNVLVPNQTVEVNLNDMFGPFIELSSGNLGVSSKSLHILSKHEITLYGVSVRLHSSDAFLGLPDDALTRRYILLSYPNGYTISGVGPGGGDGYDNPSEFAVIATEDGTSVTITPTAHLNGRNLLTPFTVGLNRGEVFFAQASLSGKEDVSGTQVRSTKPIAVFGGNRRTAIPTEVGNYRDHLVEQMPPLDAWGNSAILTPHFQVTPGVTYPAVARIVAALDNTTWEIDGVPQKTLQAGEVVEFSMTEEPMVVKASNPIMLAQYEHSVGVQNGGQFELGDPFMMLIPPPEQYDTAYAFQSVTHELFTKHYINVVVPTNAVPSVRLDNVPLVANYRPVPNTQYSYAQIPLAAGSHYVTCDSAFGLYAYGFGQANSYGYPGGTLFRQLVVDFEAPYIKTTPECGLVSGVVIDDRITDTGIDSCYSVASGTKNVNVSIITFRSGADSVFYNAMLQDPYQDGVVTIKAVDSAGRSSTQRDSIPGYTIRASKMTGNAPQQEEQVSYNGKPICQDVELVNYGKYPHKIDRLLLLQNDPSFTLNPALGFTLAPGEKRIVQICYAGGGDTIKTVSLTIGDSCIGRQVVDFTVYSIVDTVPPSNSGRIGSCDNGIEIAFEEPSAKYYGIAALQVVEAVNARTEFTPTPSGLPSSRVVMRLDPIDMRQDMIYEVFLRDMAGNETTIRDTVGGYTLAALDVKSGDQVSVRLDAEWQTESLDFLGARCDSIMLRNYGHRDLIISQVIVEMNREFSIPPAQFPLLIPHDDSVKIAVCLEGRYAGEQIDTLLIVDTCGRWERVGMKTTVGYGLGYGTDRCGQQLTIQAFAPSKRTFMTTPFPNPSEGGSVGVDIALSRDEKISIDIVDMSGESVLRVVEGVAIKGGIHRLQFEPVGLESGLYFCRMITGDGTVYTSKMMVQR